MKFFILEIILFLSLIQFIIAAKPIDGLKVNGPYIVNGDGNLAILRGASRAGTEYKCVQSNSIFDGPADASVINAMKTWGFNVVRVPLNEQCWLGYNGISSSVSGTAYINAITTWVDTIYNVGDMAVIIELHWAAPGTSAWATQQYPMPNQDHSIAFWTSVANTFKNRSYVIFEPYNEPYPDNNNWNSAEGWRCWRDGGTCNGMSYQAAGMQSLVTAIRNTGATNIIALGGIAYSNSLAQFLAYKPTDPLNNLVAVWHSYNFNFCVDLACWNQYITPVAQVMPVLATEIGENTCGSNYINNVMNYLDSIKQNYLGWTWNVWDCGSGPALIASEDGTPTNFGQGYKSHIAGTTSSFPPVPSFTPGPTNTPAPTGTPGPTTSPGPTTTPAPSGNTVYTFSWYVSANNDYWTQLLISPKPPGDVYFDCGYGQRLTTIPSWSTTQDTFILGNTNIACNTNKLVIVYVGGYAIVSKSDGTGINTVAPQTVSYTLTWNATANNAYWSQVFISPKPNVPVYMDCGYFAYPTFNPVWSTNQDTFVLGNTNTACNSNGLITVYIGTSSVQSRTDNTGTNVITGPPSSTTPAPTSAPTTAAPTTPAPTSAPTTPAPTSAPTTAAPTTPAPTSAPTTAAPTTNAPATTVAPTTVAPTTAAPTTTPAPSGNTVYTFSWYVSANNDYWTQLLISPKPPGDVYFDCGYGQRITTIPSWSTTQDTFILGNTNTACNTNKVVIVYVGGYAIVSKSDGTGINTVAPQTVSYTLTWNATANNAYWSQVFISPKPNVPVYMDCGYFAYATFNPDWSTNKDTFILGNTNKACNSNGSIKVYIGTSSVQSRTDNTGANVITLAPTTPAPTSAPTSASTTAPPSTPAPTSVPTTTPKPAQTQRSVSACIYDTPDCTGNTTSCVNSTLSTIVCNNNDPLFTNSGVSNVKSSLFSFNVSTNTVSYQLFSQLNCQGTPLTSSPFPNGGCLVFTFTRQTRSIRLTASAFTFTFSLFTFLFLILLTVF